MRSRNSRRRVPTRRSQIAFIRGAWTAERTILVPAAWKTASNEAVKFDPRSRTRDLMFSNRLPRVRARLRACCTIQSPVGCAVTPPRCIRRLPCSMNTSTYIRFSSTVSTCRKSTAEDAGGLGSPELPPRRAGPARRRIDARSAQDLPHGGRRDRHAELRQLTMDPAVPPQRILPCHANDHASEGRGRRRAAGLAPLARVVLAAGQLAVPGQKRRWRHGEDPGPAPARQEPGQRGEPHPVARLVPVSVRHSGAAPRSRAGARAVRHPSPGRSGTPGRPGRAPGTLAGKRS